MTIVSSAPPISDHVRSLSINYCHSSIEFDKCVLVICFAAPHPPSRCIPRLVWKTFFFISTLLTQHTNFPHINIINRSVIITPLRKFLIEFTCSQVIKIKVNIHLTLLHAVVHPAGLSMFIYLLMLLSHHLIIRDVGRELHEAKSLGKQHEIRRDGNVVSGRCDSCCFTHWRHRSITFNLRQSVSRRVKIVAPYNTDFASVIGSFQSFRRRYIINDRRFNPIR